MSKRAFLCPGQGSQKIGMGGTHAKSNKHWRTCFDAAQKILGFDLESMVLEGTQSELTLTQNAQPALLTVSVSFGRFLLDEGVACDMAAGHSLGEYSALVLAGAMAFEDAVMAVRRRGEWMQEAVPAGVGGMVAVLGAEDAVVEDVCRELSKEDHRVEPANYNCPGQLVISGHIKALEEASAVLKEKGAKRCIPLDVSAPFHSSLLQEVGDKMGEHLSKLSISAPEFPVYANVTGEPHVPEGKAIINLLAKQIWSPVRWTQILEDVTKQAALAFEVGPGTVVQGHLKKVNRAFLAKGTEDFSALQGELSA